LPSVVGLEQYSHNFEETISIVISQRKIRARDWLKSRHVSFTNTQCSPRGQHSS